MDTSLFLIVPFSLLILLAIIAGRLTGITLSEKWTIAARKFLVTLLVSGVVLVIMAWFDIYLRGYYTTRAFIWLLVLTSCLVYGYGNRRHIRKPIIYLCFILSVISVSSLLLLFAAGNGGKMFAFHLAVKLSAVSTIFYNDSEIRIERDYSGSRYARSPRLFKKVGILEIDRGSITCTSVPDSIKVTKTRDSITLFCYDKAYESGKVNTNPLITQIKR